MSKVEAELGRARAPVSEVTAADGEPVPNTIPDDDTGALDPRFALWRSFCAEHGVPVEKPGLLLLPIPVAASSAEVARMAAKIVRRYRRGRV